jgi:hypothetical protein
MYSKSLYLPEFQNSVRAAALTMHHTAHCTIRVSFSPVPVFVPPSLWPILVYVFSPCNGVCHCILRIGSYLSSSLFPPCLVKNDMIFLSRSLTFLHCSPTPSVFLSLSMLCTVIVSVIVSTILPSLLFVSCFLSLSFYSTVLDGFFLGLFLLAMSVYFCNFSYDTYIILPRDVLLLGILSS